MNLSELHDVVKNHPYRLSEDDKYLDSYRKLLYDLAEQFYREIVKTEFSGAKEMIHDFNCAISNGLRENASYNQNNYIIHIERCIGTIHEFINTGKVEKFYTYYSGANITPGINRVTEWIYDPDYKKGFRPLYSLTELNEAIKAIEYMQETKPEYKKHKWHTFSTEELEFFKDYRKKYYGE